ncbi:hypothetical protein NDU88_007878 [Pleurodeles waltl]|uniref:Uncharacterized protein n=1 Tax=Pleurodeles waltl TaxID=8319 RepID=A0AAV7PN58_PLEWA|nr:hypothetical protein NDU88_007878 [Pleurodeles waltl]
MPDCDMARTGEVSSASSDDGGSIDHGEGDSTSQSKWLAADNLLSFGPRSTDVQNSERHQVSEPEFISSTELRRCFSESAAFKAQEERTHLSGHLEEKELAHIERKTGLLLKASGREAMAYRE